MRRLLRVLLFLTFVTSWAVLHAQNTVQGIVPLSSSNPQLTAVDPFANGLTPSNPLKPPRPFWYVVDKNGITIMGLRTEKTGALMVGGPPIDVKENEVVGFVPWPDAIPITQPDGEVPTDPTILEDHGKFAWRTEVGGTWEPVGITVSYPTDEALASNSETPPTFVFVVMKHSGYEWQSTPQAELAPGRDPNLRDRIAPQSDLTKDGSLLVQVDVSQPNYPVDLFPTGPPIGGGLLGHDAGQPAFDPASDSVYVGNMPTLSLPTTATVPNDLTSFVSVVTLAPGELPAPGEGAPAPVTVTVLCGPEHPDIALLAGVPQSWACIAEGGEGPFQWTFTGLPSWLNVHTDPITGQRDGILYGTPPVGTYTFQAHVDDYATTPPGSGDATITLLVSSDPATEYEYGELEWEVGTPAAVAIEGTPKAAGDPCALEPTSSPGSLVPSWVSVKQITGRQIDNTAVGGPVENTIGCVVMGTPPISGERYEFQMPNFQFAWPSNNLPILFTGQVLGPYVFDPLPAGIGLSGLAWHQIDKIHDASTEADLLNREFFGVEPYTGQVYRIVAPYAGLEAEGTVVPPPALVGELDEIEPYTEVLTPLLTARPDIAAALAATGNSNLKVRFGNVAVEANPNAQVFVTATEISDSTGVDPTVIPIGGAAGSSIPLGALIKVSGTRDAQDPEALTFSTASPIDLPGVQGYYLGLDSDLAPAVPGEPAQYDNGLLWVTGPLTGNVATVDTAGGTFSQLLTITGAGSLGGVSVYPNTRKAYVASPLLNNVTIFGPGTAPDAQPVIWSASSTIFIRDSLGLFKVVATGSPIPALSYAGDLPSGVTFTDNGNGTATLTGTPGAEGNYAMNFTATNVMGTVSQNFSLIVNPPTQPAVTIHPSNQATTEGQTATFAAAASGAPTPTAQWQQSTNSGVTWADITGATSTSYTTPVTTIDMSGYQYRAVFTNIAGSATSNAASLTVNAAPKAVPAITMHPSNQTVAVGQAATFTAAASGNPTPTVQWEASTGGNIWYPITGATNTSYTTSAAQTFMNGTQYRAVFTNSEGSATSNPAILTVTENAGTAPTITSANSITFTVGSAESFTVTATGSPTPQMIVQGALPSGVQFVDNSNGTGTLFGTPAAGTERTYPLTITAANGVNPNGSQSFTLIVAAAANNPPVATAQSVTTTEDTAKSIVLAGTDADGDGLTYAVVAQPQHGSLTGTAPNLTYTPAANYNGSESFTFKVNDGKADSALATVSITVSAVNDAPVAAAQSVTTQQDTAKTITLNGSDVDGDALSYSVGNPQHGNLTGTAPALTYTPTAGYSGSDSFTFTVNDGTVSSAPATVSITVTAVVQPLLIVTTSLPDGTVGTQYSVQLQASGGTQPYIWSSPARLPFGLRLSSTGLISGKPNAAGITTFAVEVRDSGSQSTSTSLRLTINVKPPRPRR